MSCSAGSPSEAGPVPASCHAQEIRSVIGQMQAEAERQLALSASLLHAMQAADRSIQEMAAAFTIMRDDIAALQSDVGAMRMRDPEPQIGWPTANDELQTAIAELRRHLGQGRGL